MKQYDPNPKARRLPARRASKEWRQKKRRKEFVQVYCYRCGPGAPECWQGPKEMSWDHDRLWVYRNEDGTLRVSASYCCEAHHGLYSEFLLKFINSPFVTGAKVREALLQEYRRALEKDKQKLMEQLKKLQEEISHA